MCADAVASRDDDCTLLMTFTIGSIAPELFLQHLLEAIRKPGIPLADLSVFVAQTEPFITCYVENPARLPEPGELARFFIDTPLLQLSPENMEISRLQNVARHRGAAAGEPAGFHYVVRTDVEAGGEAELQTWYDREHMPMLAAVPGTVHARRLLCLDAGPQFYACYDLLAPAVIESGAWLKVRATPWSERVRPTFRNTQRIMFRRLPLLQQETA